MLGRLRRSIQSFFKVSRSESNAFLLLIPLMLVILFSEYIYRQWWFAQPRDTKADQRKLDSLLSHWPTDSVASAREAERTFFNPNRVTAEFLIATGLRKDVAQRIVNYRNKGGTFRIKTDLLRMYGMDTAWFAIHRTWLQLPDTIPTNKSVRARPTSTPVLVPEDINQADSLALIQLRGIGPVFANRILRFRRALGGFHSIDQLREVYKIDTTQVKTLTTHFFIAADFQPKKISLNTADEATLAAHPYVSRNQARAIVAYRFQHGPFQSIEELTKVHLISSTDWQRIFPYLEL